MRALGNNSAIAVHPEAVCVAIDDAIHFRGYTGLLGSRDDAVRFVTE